MNDELIKRLQDEIIKTICTGLPGPNACKAPDCECYEGNGKPVFNAIKPLFAALSAQQSQEPVAYEYRFHGNALGHFVLSKERKDWADSGTGLWTERPLYTAPASGAKEGMIKVPDGLIAALRTQRQIDEDGTECGVSRQAVDEAAEILEAITRAADQVNAEGQS